MNTPDLNAQFAPFATRMSAENLPDIFIDTFKHYYGQLLAGETGMIAETAIEPVENLPDAETLPETLADVGQAALSQTILLKLNGGLGTSMGLQKAKSLLPVKDQLSFLDIIARQALQANVPLVLMDSFSTQNDTLSHLAQYEDRFPAIPRDFLQHKAPKISQKTLQPIEWPANPSLSWYPPGHGDIYTALLTSGMLDKLLAAGYRYAAIANADNLGAVLDHRILGYFVQQAAPFMMEVADRTEADKKGGHLARRPNGQLLLRESAQCPNADMAHFQDITRHKYFNTNNLWLNLEMFRQVVDAQQGVFALPLIRNAKTVDPRDPASAPVYQLETAMGAAIGVFAEATALRVPRTRFAPVKTTNDLLAVRSDAYQLTDDFHVVPNPNRQLGQVVVNLDPKFYKLVSQLDQRFPHGAPSLLYCRHFTVQGNIHFGPNITIEGEVTLANNTDQPLHVAAGKRLHG